MVTMNRIAAIPLYILLFLTLGCQSNTKDPEHKSTISLTTVAGERQLYLQNEARSFFIQLKSNIDWEVLFQGVSAEVISLTPQKGSSGQHAIAVSIEANNGGLREALVIARSLKGDAADTLYIIQEGEKSDKERILGDTTLIELPRLSGDANDFFITHKVENGTRVNYSLEWNCKKYHSRWVCFSFDQYTAQINTKRSDAWSWDPLVPTKYEVYRNDFESRTYARGHMVASFDRIYSSEANIQTFYYTNMSPQRHEHNEGIWGQLEGVVQGWARSMGKNEKLYIAKGGTIRDDQIEFHRSNNKLVIPKYYWMAIARQNGTEWHAIAFLTETARPAKLAGGVAPMALSVDELETFTGLDFFYHLPDDIENRIEAENPTANKLYWPGL